MTNLKPCPFCGNTEIRIYQGSALCSSYNLGCGTRGPSGDDDVDAARLWNDRIADPRTQQKTGGCALCLRTDDTGSGLCSRCEAEERATERDHIDNEEPIEEDEHDE